MTVLGKLGEGANRILGSALTFPIIGRHVDNADIGVLNILEKGPRGQAARRGLHPVILWALALLMALVAKTSLCDGTGDGSDEVAAISYLVGTTATATADADAGTFTIAKDSMVPNLGNTPWSVLGFNIIQLLSLASAGVALGLKSWAEEGKKEADDAGKMAYRVVDGLAQVARLGIDAVFLTATLGAIVYAGLAFDKVNHAPANGGLDIGLGNAEGDALTADQQANLDALNAREGTVAVISVLALNFLTLLSFIQRDSGKVLRSAADLEARAAAEDAAVGSDVREFAGVDLAAKDNNLKIHSYY